MARSRQAIVVSGLVAGAVIWLFIAALSGRAEAWDSPLYAPIGLPLLVLAAGVLGYLFRGRPFTVAFSISYGQALALLICVQVGSLLPLGLVLFAIFALPLVPFAALGGWLGRRGDRIATSD
ncbi:MAG: hypothetical protein ACREDZ_16845 [Kiloniellales bacterium]